MAEKIDNPLPEPKVKPHTSLEFAITDLDGMLFPIPEDDFDYKVSEEDDFDIP